MTCSRQTTGPAWYEHGSRRAVSLGNRGYMALAVLIAVMADGLAWTLNIGVAVLAGAAAAGIVHFALSV